MRAGAIQLNATDDTDRNLWARGIAAELGLDLLAGSFSERGPGPEKGYNTSVHIGPDGETRAVYRKIHLFDLTVDGANDGEAATQTEFSPCAERR